MYQKFLIIVTYFLIETFQQNFDQSSPIRIIDIFTNYPDRNEVLKEYSIIQQRRNNTNNPTGRSYSDYYRPYDHRNIYHDYRDTYHGNYYGDHSNTMHGQGDILESEFGVFDDGNNFESLENDGNVGVHTQGSFSGSTGGNFGIYTHGNVDGNVGFGGSSQAGFAVNAQGNIGGNSQASFGVHTQGNFMGHEPVTFEDKLDMFMANVQGRPVFQTKNSTQDKFNFEVEASNNEVDSGSIESEYGEIVTKPPRKRKIRPNRKPTRKPTTLKRPLQKPVTGNTTRNRVTNLLRKYLIKMHKPKHNRVNRKHSDKDRTINFIDHNKKTEFQVDYKLPDTQGKFLAKPLEQLKNKTMKFANKFLSLFTVIQFPNFKCQANSALSEYEGTCYLASECSQMNGIAMGNCADGHGVCCVFKGTCGGVGSNNCTYFESPGYPNYFPEGGGVVVPPTETTTTANPNTPDPRLQFLFRQGRAGDSVANALSCIFKVYKSEDGIRQMRIDFIDLELKGPTNGECLDEKLIISGAGLNTMVPVICGYNTGQHIYVDVDSLSGPLQIAVLANNIERKRYKLKICQYKDGCSGLMNCLQYYTGISGVITSFNYEKAASFSRSNPQYLNNLNYAICIKREPGYCTITYTTTGPNNLQYPFELKNFDDDGMLTVPKGQAGVGVLNCPDDYIVVNGIRLCGDRLNDGSVQEDFSKNAPVTDYSGGPIVIPVRTSSATTGMGFKLFFMQNKCMNGMGGTGGMGGVPDPRL